MHDIITFDHPLRFWCQSNTHDFTWYLVDLSDIGDPDSPKGFCGCPGWEFQMDRIARDKPFRLCSHLSKVRAHVRERILAGEYDQWLQRLEHPIPHPDH